jgi:tetratricopeptide (TPR) repeat protein
MLASVPQNSIIICSGDTSCFSLFYASIVEKFRPDVTVLSQNTKYRRWYLQHHPQLYPFIYHQNPDFVASLLSWHVSQHPTYITLPSAFYTQYIGFQNDPFTLIPNGLLFQVSSSTSAHLTHQINHDRFSQLFVSEIDPKDYFKIGLKNYFSGLFNLQGIFYAQIDQPSQADEFFQLSIDFNPQNPLSPNLQQQLKNPSLKIDRSPPPSYDQYLDLAKENLQYGDLDIAYEYARKASYIKPGRSSTHRFMGQILEQGGYQDLADLEYQQALIFDTLPSTLTR